MKIPIMEMLFCASNVLSIGGLVTLFFYPLTGIGLILFASPANAGVYAVMIARIDPNAAKRR